MSIGFSISESSRNTVIGIFGMHCVKNRLSQKSPRSRRELKLSSLRRMKNSSRRMKNSSCLKFDAERTDDPSRPQSFTPPPLAKRYPAEFSKPDGVWRSGRLQYGSFFFNLFVFVFRCLLASAFSFFSLVAFDQYLLCF